MPTATIEKNSSPVSSAPTAKARLPGRKHQGCAELPKPAHFDDFSTPSPFGASPVAENSATPGIDTAIPLGDSQQVLVEIAPPSDPRAGQIGFPKHGTNPAIDSNLELRGVSSPQKIK